MTAGAGDRAGLTWWKRDFHFHRPRSFTTRSSKDSPRWQARPAGVLFARARAQTYTRRTMQTIPDWTEARDSLREWGWLAPDNDEALDVADPMVLAGCDDCLTILDGAFTVEQLLAVAVFVAGNTGQRLLPPGTYKG